jgi:hypothetical protein
MQYSRIVDIIDQRDTHHSVTAVFSSLLEISVASEQNAIIQQSTQLHTLMLEQRTFC